MNQGLEIRLQKVIADCGVTSRRKAEHLILQGKVSVNGEVVTTLGTKVNPHKDMVEVDGQPIDLLTVDHVYLVFNKPRSVVTTVSDPEGRPTVMDYFQRLPQRVYPVGRLDYLSEGLLILTNDGDMANQIMHPRYEVNKVYEVKVFGKVNEALLNKLRLGVYDHDGLLKPKSVRVVAELDNKTWIEFRLQEGKNREIRRLCEACGLTIDKLRRVAIEDLSIDGLPPGHFKFLTKKELLNALGMNKDGTKSKVTRDYISVKKTVDLKKRKIRTNDKIRMADDQEFHKFRKENYLATIAKMKEIKETIRAQKEASGEFKKTAAPRFTRDKTKTSYRK
jgi:23S rRNA pseudouridine2605 synthase